MVSRHTKHLSLKLDSKLKGFVIVVGKKVAKLAVHRNKLKRRLREILRKKDSGGTIYTKTGADELMFDELRKEVSELLD